ncbi:MAG: hypothetical protein QGG40_21940, partial [Myxococcota bacterium]|nr:hypothetical protein [Myxococcota bacterium]
MSLPVQAPPEGFVVEDVGFAVTAVVTDDQCQSDTTSEAWTALGGARGGAAVMRAEIGQPEPQGLAGAKVRTGRTAQVAVIEDETRVTAFVADGTGFHHVTGSTDDQRSGLRIYDITDPDAPEALKSCALGLGEGEIRSVVPDEIGWVWALVSEGAEGDTSSIVGLWGSALEPCTFCGPSGCTAMLQDAEDPEGTPLWLNPRRAAPNWAFNGLEEFDACSSLYHDLIVVGAGTALLQVVQTSLLCGPVVVLSVLAAERMPLVTELTSIAVPFSNYESGWYVVGTQGQDSPLMVLSKFDIYYNIPDPGPMVPVGALDY